MSIVGTPEHTIRVARLYKRCLKLSLDWTIRRDVWRVQALEIRRLFDANRNVTNPKLVASLIDKTEKDLERNWHPDPYKAPTSPEGTKWERHGLPDPEDPRHFWKTESTH
ncbi:hypothetical protein K493DRAFT_279790 [Basidiobolus meristosporus CBS 931.73]|uniref:NADH dehydrogenase [ubiquinone] 1 beta subcomplex subunit 9 n=1 Tax=Basidiobolus meristosporus CBS 931.73 TaxID=1314790 RepID=A0A1Y1YNC2_9FUNG|nr:hypothetical protein K493DRAFT_279790 [Basidiobolus meristosporus CBS 931.73]|eukprot:ORX99266.1 hypothetical protein K493DRAFT_279790 [Basidiobolus meristosporus CBS 931.73]